MSKDTETGRRAEAEKAGGGRPSSVIGRPSSNGVREEGKPSQRPVWVVFARRKYDEPLYQVGTVTAESPDMAAVYARSIYDEHPWIEMVVVPRKEIKTVIAS